MAALLGALSLILLLSALAEVASAKTFRVNNRRDKVDANPGDGRCDADLNKKGKQCTLRAASQEADFDEDTIDTIRVPKNVYKLTIPSDSCGDDTSCGDIDLDGKVNLIGAGPFKAIIDAKKARDRGLELGFNTFGCKPPPKHFPDYGDYCKLSGIGVKNGRTTDSSTSSGDGGGMYIGGSTLVVTHVAAWRNKGRDGGGINLSCTCYQFNHVTANHNKARANGGGLYQSGNTITHMKWITVKGNQALGTDDSDCCGHGGGVFFGGNTLYDVKYMFVRANVAEALGGGMYIGGDTDWFHGLRVNLNKAKGDGGGGIYESGPTLFFFGFTVNNNRAPKDGARGGGIWVDGATDTFTRGTIANNSVGQGGDGGGVATLGTDYWVNDTITGNRAPGGRGGGIFNDSSSEYLDNLTIASNKAPTGANLWNDAYTAFLNTIVAYSPRHAHNCDGGGFYDDRGHNLDSGHSCHFNLPSDIERKDPKLAPLRGNGGFSPTRALKPGSPAIDHGKDRKLHWTIIDAGFGSVYPFVYGNGFPDDMGCAESNLNNKRDDQRLIKRPQRKHCDIGAFEARNSKRSGNR